MVKKAKLLWMDLEMTGLSPKQDRILEVACVWTGWDLEVMGEYQAVVKVPEEVIKERMIGEFWEKNSESKRALVAQNVNGRDVLEVEEELLAIIEKWFGKEIYLAGNSIHQDRKFVDKEWKRLAKKLHYRMLDVSAWKIYFAGAMQQKFVKREEHRAMSDILGSIEEMKFYRGFLKGKND